MKKEIISTLVGLAGACRNGEKTSDTDSIFLKAVSLCFSDISDGEAARIAEEVCREKFRVSPNCETCKNPCGNTSDFDVAEYEAARDNKELRLEMLQKAAILAGKIEPGSGLIPLLYQAVSYFGCDLDPSAYPPVIEELDQALA